MWPLPLPNSVSISNYHCVFAVDSEMAAGEESDEEFFDTVSVADDSNEADDDNVSSGSTMVPAAPSDTSR